MGKPGSPRLADPRRLVGTTTSGLACSLLSRGTEDRAARRRVYQPAAIAAGVTGDLRPYRLRASFVSLLLWEGRSLAYVAEQAGHSIATLAKHYAGVIRELENAHRKPAPEAILQARKPT